MTWNDPLNRKALLMTLLSAAVFSLSLAVYWYPFHAKGYAPAPAFDVLIGARNMAAAGTAATEDAQGLLLSSRHAKADGRAADLTSPLTPVIYGWIFRLTGAGTAALAFPSYLSIILAAIFNVMIFLLIARLAGLRAGLFGAAAMLLMPERIIGALFYGGYEFAMLFFAAALWSFLGAKNGPSKAGTVRLIYASVFFALAALSRNAFLISFAPFVLFDLWKHRSWKRCAALVLPFLILFGPTMTPWSWFGASNGYFAGAGKEPFSLLGEVFPDPYTAFHDRDAFISTLTAKGLNRSGAHFLAQWGYAVSMRERFAAYLGSARYYLGGIVDPLMYGGWLITGLMALGAWRLYRRSKDLFLLFAAWAIIWFCSVVWFQTGNEYHFLEVIFIAATLTGIGAVQVLEALETAGLRPPVAGGAFLACLMLYMLSAGQLRLSLAYRVSFGGSVKAAAEKIAMLPDPGVVAAGMHPGFSYGVAYFTDTDVIYFNPRTIDALIAAGKLKAAFDIYHVKTAVGFSEKASQAIRAETGAEVIEVPLSGQSS